MVFVTMVEAFVNALYAYQITNALKMRVTLVNARKMAICVSMRVLSS